MEAWKHALVNDESADYVPDVTKKPRKKMNEDSVKSGTKRKAVCPPTDPFVALSLSNGTTTGTERRRSRTAEHV